MDMSGVQNVVDADKLTFPTWSFEQVLQSAPDVVINGMVGASDLQSVLAGAGVEAAKSGRYVSEVNLAILRPGPETVLGAIELADAIKSVYQANPPTKEVAE